VEQIWPVVRLRNQAKPDRPDACLFELAVDLDEIFVKVNGEIRNLRRPVDHEGEVLESYVTKRRDHKAALKFPRKSMKRFGNPAIIVTDKLRSYGAAMKQIGNAGRQETGR